jgi:hypothetical protein
VGDDDYTVTAVDQFLTVSAIVLPYLSIHVSDAERSVLVMITYRRQLVNVTFNTAWLWVKEIRYHSIYVSASIYRETNVAHSNIRNIVRHLGGVDRASQALIRW